MPDKESGPAEAGAAIGPGIGERLRAAREKRGLSVDQLAEYLRLDESVVAALEADDFDALGAPVFVRGHLKTTARFLELDVDDLLGEYAAAAPQPVVRPAAPGSGTSAPITINLVPWGAGALGLLMAVGLTIYLLQDDPESAPAASALAPSVDSKTPAGEAAPAATIDTPPVVAPTAQAERQALAEPVAPAREPEPMVEVEDRPEPALASADSAPAAVVAAEAEPAPADTATQTLTLYFRGESWTEISDRNGRLLFGLQREGIRRELSGEAPFKLLLGNAPAVDLYVDDEPYDLPAGSTRGKVARFVIESDSGQSFP
jgi:cytoskeleton protein RodZ